ncbi:MAG: pilus assembly protein [Hyphomicrobium sp.]
MSSNTSNTLTPVNSALTCCERVRLCFAAFGDDQRGTVAMIFGLMAVTMVMMMGAAVDTGRWLHAHSQTKAAVDSAVLAGARSLQVTGGDTAAALTLARSYYKSNVQSRPQVKADSIDFAVSDGGKAIRATGTAFINTPFLALANIKRLALWKEGGSEYSQASTMLGGGRDQALEISIMLDVTGSMGGQKIADLKDAANDLVDIILPDSDTAAPAKIALAPFAETVRPGAAYLTQVRGTKPATVKVKDSRGNFQTYKLTDCVSERSGSAAYTDAAPAGGNLMGAVYSKSGSCTPGAAIQPLTADKSKLTTAINAMTASGGTAGHLGSAWAWYLLSPNWSSLWTGDSQPASYSDTGVKKIAILMTDGEYNTQYDATGVMTSTSGKAALNGASATQALSVCANMKAEGIEVYTVGFALNDANAIQTLRTCASNAGTAYVAQDGAQLRNAFRDIAIKLSPIHLTN